MELALKESEERFRSLVDNSHAGIWMVDKFYRFIYMNEHFCRIMGYGREELAGKDFRSLLAEESLAQARITMSAGYEVSPFLSFGGISASGTERLGVDFAEGM